MSQLAICAGELYDSQSDGELLFNEEPHEDDEDFIEMPVDITSCLALNHAYRRNIRDLLESVEKKLRVNRRIQEQLGAAKNSKKESTVKLISGNRHPNSMLVFMAPYFKDIKGLHPPPNEDVETKKRNGEINLAYLQPNKPWSEAEKEQLTKAVYSGCTKYHLEPLYKEKRLKIRQVEENPENDLYREEVKALELKIGELARKPPEELLLPREVSPKLDWLLIATQLDTSHSAAACELMWSNFLHPDVNKKSWNFTEDETLKLLVQKHGNDWDSIASDLGTRRLAWQCLSRYQSEVNPLMKRTGPLSKAEQMLLHRVISDCRIGDFIPWTQVNFFMEGRTLTQIKHYWNKINLPKRGISFTDLEDKVLEVAVNKYGTHNWRKVASFLPGRNNRQCRERYMMRINVKDRKFGSFTAEEDEKILTLAPKLHFSWARLAEQIPNRNARQISSRYDFLIKQGRSHGNDNSSNEGNRRVITRKLFMRPKEQEALTKNRLQLLGLSESTMEPSDEEFLRVSKIQLSRDVQRVKTRPPPAGRCKRTVVEETVDNEIVKRFKQFAHLHKKPSMKVQNLSVQEQLVAGSVHKSLLSLLSGEQPVSTHLLSQVVNAAVESKVTKCFDSVLKMPSILPPNRNTVTAFQHLLAQRNFLEERAKLWAEQHGDLTQGVNIDSNYKLLVVRFVALFFWPAILGRAEAPEKPDSCNGTKAHGEKRREQMAQTGAQLHKIRNKQNELFRSAIESNGSSENKQTKAIVEPTPGPVVVAEVQSSRRTPKRNAMYDSCYVVSDRPRKRTTKKKDAALEDAE